MSGHAASAATRTRLGGGSADGGRVDARRIDAVRAFNRQYTRLVGALDEGHLRTPFSLAEARVLYEVAHRDRPEAAAIARDLALDAGYLSRLLAGLEGRGVVARAPSPTDGRRSTLQLTDAGRGAFAELDAHARDAVAALLAPLADDVQARVVDAMHTIAAALGPAGGAARGRGAGAVVLRAPGPGDLGWVVERHGALYAAEYGWGPGFEARVARIVADFAADHDPARERAWIAEHAGARVGSVFLVRHPERPGVAKLRLLLVEPAARGLGAGGRLVDACTAFARAAGYHTVTLWTNSVLAAARRLYERAGYRLVDEAPHESFGRPLVGQTWELALGPAPAAAEPDASA
jgi:DNA-binding MarR family transcriptional regulator/N-acetylglutamate synthase-like GNAT family acetyltransferase